MEKFEKMMGTAYYAILTTIIGLPIVVLYWIVQGITIGIGIVIFLFGKVIGEKDMEIILTAISQLIGENGIGD